MQREICFHSDKEGLILLISAKKSNIKSTLSKCCEAVKHENL